MEETVDDRLLAAIDRLARSSGEVAEALSTMPPENVELIVGLFDETIPAFAQRELAIAFIHVDCDIHSSTRSIFTGLKSQIRPGCVIVFDEYFNYVGFEKHERLAFDEFIGETNYGVNWISYSGQQAACVLTTGT
ncbi:hypothetical protein J2R96_002440 [Bradyrhizobium elkanii]|nr:hypothetical protein [Bradyrhizobium elkanii]